MNGLGVLLMEGVWINFWKLKIVTNETIRKSEIWLLLDTYYVAKAVGIGEKARI